MNRSTVLILVLILFAVPVLAQSGTAAGTWDVTLNSPQGTFNIQFKLKQDGEKLSGVVASQRGEFPLEGTLKGKDLILKWTTKFEDNDLPITLNGVFDGGAMKGSADYGGFAQGDFTAKRAGDAAAAPSAPAAAAPSGDKIDVTGAWAFQIETPNGPGTPTFTFKQEGEKLTGQYKGRFGEAPFTGTVKGNNIDFTLKLESQGQELTITYIGTVEKDGTMKGTLKLGGADSGKWTGKRQ
jgi:hypothetical protein